MNVDVESGVVIYGGGVAGAVLAKALSATVPVTLVDPLDYFEVPMAAPRSMVDPAFSEGSIFSFSEAMPQVRHVRAKLEELLPDGKTGLVLGSAGERQKIIGDVVVLATGSGFANKLMRGTDDTVASPSMLTS